MMECHIKINIECCYFVFNGWKLVERNENVFGFFISMEKKEKYLFVYSLSFGFESEGNVIFMSEDYGFALGKVVFFLV